MIVMWKDLLKGIAIGMSNVVPGLSGATMAVVLGVYERLIDFFAMISKNPVKAIRSFWVLLLGMVIGIVLAIFVVVFLLMHFPIISFFFLSGLILGAIPKIVKKIDFHAIKAIDILVFLVFAGVMLVLPLLGQRELNMERYTIFSFAVILLMGVLAASSMIIPGLSGSMVLWVFGYYIWITVLLKEMISQFFSFELVQFFASLWMFFPFVIGVIIGLIFISKLIRKAIVKKEQTVYSAILALLVLSPYIVIISMVNEYNDVIVQSPIWMWLLGVLFGLIGLILGYMMDKLKKKKNENLV